MADWLSEETYRSAPRTRSSVPPARGGVCFELEILEGPDAGCVLRIDASRGTGTLVGSSAMCAVRLADTTVAPRQCSFELDADKGTLKLVDLAPEKSTRVNGVLAHEAYLLGGEVVRIGATVIGVTRIDPAATAPTRTSFGRIHGDAMAALHAVFEHLAQEAAPLEIAGERGTGKRLLAEELHAHGPFRAGPFVVVPRNQPGSLTPARIEEASGGTLYIEEGADLDRVTLGYVLGLGDVRVIVGTRAERPLAAPIAHRLVLPPLRERASDVAPVARRLWVELGGEGSLPDDFVARFAEHAWPGNIRELKIAIQDRILHGQEETTVSGVVEVRPAPADAMNAICDKSIPFADARGEVLAEFERRYVARALEKSGQNVARAAANSGIAHRYFQVLKSRRKTA